MTRSAQVFALLLACAACGGEREPPYPVRFFAHADGAPVGRAQILADGDVVGTTGPDGILFVEVDGREGAELALSARCPEGHRDPESLPRLQLRRVSGFDENGTPSAVRIDIPCAPVVRHAVLLVSASGLSHVPVTLDGREVARTSELGISHVAVALAAGDRFEVGLDTRALTDVAPRSPSRAFTLGDADGLFVFAPRLERVGQRAPAAPRHARPRGAPMRMPERLGSSR